MLSEFNHLRAEQLKVALKVHEIQFPSKIFAPLSLRAQCNTSRRATNNQEINLVAAIE
jgi:hypothetical protein